VTDFDDLLPGLRRQYMHDAEFHAFVTVLFREKYRDLVDENERLRAALERIVAQSNRGIRGSIATIALAPPIQEEP
jgi:hypothetical protein